MNQTKVSPGSNSSNGSAASTVTQCAIYL